MNLKTVIKNYLSHFFRNIKETTSESNPNSDKKDRRYWSIGPLQYEGYLFMIVDGELIIDQTGIIEVMDISPMDEREATNIVKIWFFENYKKWV